MMIFRKIAFCVGACGALICSIAQAHFIWLDQAEHDGQPRLMVYFGEEPAPGEGHLLEKIGHIKTWVRNTAGKSTEVTVKTPKEGEPAALSGECPKDTACSSEAFCDYGVYSHGGPGVLLQYYAKHLAGDWVNNCDLLAKTDKLSLDIVPSTKDRKLALTVFYQGKPATKETVVVVDPAEEHHELTTDANGQVELPELIAGEYSVRANVNETSNSGERDGKKYNQVWHYGTLTFDVPKNIATKIAEVSKKTADPDAVAALIRSRDGRAIWNDFPGFSAEIKVSGDDVNAQGTVSIDSNGAATLDFQDKSVETWLEEQLSTLVQHRMPDGEVTDGIITWAEKDASHPLGRMIDLGDPNLKSRYRLKDDVIMEVNRTAGPNMHFTISVLEIEYNREGKYLPRSFTMNFFDNKSGEVKTSLAYLNEWQRVGDFDLPKTIVEVNTKAGKSTTKRIDFVNAKILK